MALTLEFVVSAVFTSGTKVPTTNPA